MIQRDNRGTKHLVGDVKPGDMHVADWRAVGHVSPAVILVVGVVPQPDGDHVSVSWINTRKKAFQSIVCNRLQLFEVSVLVCVAGEKACAKEKAT